MQMATLPAQRQPRTLMPDLGDLFTGPSMLSGLRPLFDKSVIRVEDSISDGRYELRAEIPGVDPANDIDVTVDDGHLNIKAVRAHKAETQTRSEFSYGAFARSVPLPVGANVDDIKATYDKGILTVSVPVPNGVPAAKRIEVEAASSE
jgi:HSP20 family protein